MEKQNIYITIRSLADVLKSDISRKRNGQIDEAEALKMAMPRADLVFELREAGAQLSDSTETSSLVWEAYQYFNRDENIRYAFVNNARTRFLVDDYRICGLSDNDERVAIFDVFDSELQHNDTALSRLSSSIKSLSQTLSSPATASLTASITGSAEVVAVRNNAAKTYNTYSKLVDSYRQAETEIKSTVVDFTFLRSHIEEVYRKYTMSLIDCFGDSVKTISPEIFDFDTIEWIDIESMLNQIKLEYDSISDKCAALISEISDSFEASIKSSISTYRQTGGKTAGLLMAGLTMLNHYMESEEKSAVVKQDFLKFQNIVKRDLAVIQGDRVRLAAIYRTMNDLYIPRARAYAEYAEKVLNADLLQLFDSLYATPELKKLRDQRDAMLSECRGVEQRITDIEQNIAYYKNHLAACRKAYKENEEEKNLAESRRPVKPFFLFNLLSFGTLQTKYIREAYEWKQVCWPVIKQFEELAVDISLDEKDLAEQKNLLKEARVERKKLKEHINKLNAKIMSQVAIDSDIQRKIAKHLSALVLLLKSAKNVIGSSLNENLTKAAKLPEIGTLQLAEAEQTNISRLIHGISKLNIELNNDTDIQPDESSERQQFDELQNRSVERLSKLLDTMYCLSEMERQQNVNDEIYKREFERLKAEYKKEIEVVENKSAVLREALKRVHTSDKIDDIRAGLIAMAGIDANEITPEKFTLFLNGEAELII